MFSKCMRIRCFSKSFVGRTLSQKVPDKKTCLYDFHLEHKGKIVDFAGFAMPLVYGDQSVSASHKHTRNHVSIFDVSHMLQSSLRGKDSIPFMESLIVSDIQGLKESHGTLSVFTNEKGGIKDDLIVTKVDSENLYIVSNAGCIQKDVEHIKRKLEEFRKEKPTCDVQFELLEDKALLALQGPGTAKLLRNLISYDLDRLTFMTSVVTTIRGIECRVTRCGYTGEDGVEISVPSEKARFLAETFLSSSEENVKLAGLAARDSLRLEAGLCLYGSDIDEDTTPVEAGLTWTIGKRRRTTGGFPGADIILRQLKEKPLKKRIGLISQGPLARTNTKILDEDDNTIGKVTSGLPSPCLAKNIAMGYLPSTFCNAGRKVKYSIRNQLIDAEVVKMPFVPTKYFTGR